MMKRAVAVLPGEQPKTVRLTVEEEAERIAEEEANLAAAPPEPRFEAEALAVEASSNLAQVKAALATLIRKL